VISSILVRRTSGTKATSETLHKSLLKKTLHVQVLHSIYIYIYIYIYICDKPILQALVAISTYVSHDIKDIRDV
jgi:hypothetical protein